MGDTPQPSDMHHLAVSRLMDELLLVKAEELQHHPGAEREHVEQTGDVAVFKEAERLLQKHGASIFATALALLDGRHAELMSEREDAPSLLTGRSGYTCFLAYDPEHSIVEGEEAVRRILLAMLPRRAGEHAVGKIVKTSNGYVADVRRDWAAMLVNDIRTGRAAGP